LRERKEDLLYLAKRFLDLTNQELQKSVLGFSELAIRTLLNHPWPGNVRQLRSTIRRAVLLADGEVTEHHLDILQGNSEAWWHKASPVKAHAVSITGLSLKEIVAENKTAIEREVLSQALSQTGGNKAKAARLLHVDYKTVQTKLKQYRIGAKEERMT
jgi:two-component system nitrogen regulation response regulator GlnG